MQPPPDDALAEENGDWSGIAKGVTLSLLGSICYTLASRPPDPFFEGGILFFSSGSLIISLGEMLRMLLAAGLEKPPPKWLVPLGKFFERNSFLAVSPVAFYAALRACRFAFG